jgi:hypothetical protein
MSSEVLERVVATKEAAHEAAKQAYAHAQALLLNGAKRVVISTAEQEDDRTLKQNRFYWGPCLKEISQQALILGERWTDEAWHEYFKREFLGYEITKVRVAGRKRPTIIRRLRSTTTLKVKAMSEYLDKVQAFAATELGVQFSVRNWQEFQG